MLARFNMFSTRDGAYLALIMGSASLYKVRYVSRRISLLKDSHGIAAGHDA